MTSLKVEFGKKVKEYRKSAGLTQEKLAEIVSIAPQTLSGIETGYGFPSYPVLVDLIAALKISAHHLFTFDSDIKDLDDKELQSVVMDAIHKIKPNKRKLAIDILKTIANS